MSIKHIEENGPKWQIKKKGEESSILNRHNQGIVAIKNPKYGLLKRNEVVIKSGTYKFGLIELCHVSRHFY